MLQVKNETPFTTALGVFPNPEGVDCVYGVLKATFKAIGQDVVPADEQLAVVLADEYWGDPEDTSLKTAGELTLSKPATDILMVGHAYAPGGVAQQSAVRVRVGTVEKTVYVYGNRVWLPGVTGYSISEPQPFQKIPLRYEYAFGGYDPDPIDAKRPDYEPRNPIGRGLVPLRSHKSASSRVLPNLEDPKRLIKSPLDRPAPACFAPACPQWEPRKSMAGTYDDDWTANRAPFLPLDFDSRFFHTAPDGLVSKTFLTGGEAVDITGATKEQPWRFTLPQCHPEFAFKIGGRTVECEPVLDTVIFEPDAQRFMMIWRACQVVDKRLHQMQELRMTCRDFVKRSAA